MSTSTNAAAYYLRGAAGASRSGLLDVVRIFAGFDIVAFHTGIGLGGQSVFRLGIGMAIFLMMTSVSVGTFRGERPFVPFLRERSVRYLLPFLFWCAVYGAVHMVHALRHDLALFSWVEPRMAWQGTEVQLWFMPVALGLSVVVEGLRRMTRRAPSAAILASVLLASPLLLYATPHWLRPIATRNWHQWLWIIPAVPMGLALGRLLVLPRTRLWPFMMLAFVGAFAAVGIVSWHYLQQNYPLRFAVAAFLIGVGFAVPFPSSLVLYRLRALSAGIFLCHMLVVRVFLRFLEDLPVPLAAAVIWGLSACLAFGLQATPLARFVGDPPERRPSARLAPVGSI